MGWIALIMSLLIAGCAAYFSITGLAVLFAAALIPVIIMTTTLEVGKLGATFFLHRYWDDLPHRLKWPMTMMVVILMVITSMGIFGFLSKGHIEQETPSVTLNIDIEDADEQIAAHNERIKQYKQETKIINDSINKMIEHARVSRKGGALDRMKEFKPQLDAAQVGIDHQQQQIRALRALKSKAKREVSGIEAKLGPIKYVAELFGFDLAKDADGKGKAVRIIIVMFMIAFDPFAIFLIMAADWTFMRHRKEQRELKEEEDGEAIDDEKEEVEKLQKEILETANKTQELDDALLAELQEIITTHETIVNTKDEEITLLNELVDANVIERIVWRETEVPVEVEDNTRVRELEATLITLEQELEEKTVELNEYLEVLEELGNTLDAKPTEVEVKVEDTAKVDALEADLQVMSDEYAAYKEVTDTLAKEKSEASSKLQRVQNELDTMRGKMLTAENSLQGSRNENTKLQSQIDVISAQNVTLSDDISARDKAVQALNTKYNLVEKIPGLAIQADNSPTINPSTGFGTDFPTDPVLNQMFLRVDTMPSKLFRFEGTRWMEAEKDSQVEYDEKYLTHMINELGDGNLELNDLSTKEQQEIENMLSKEDVLGK